MAAEDIKVLKQLTDKLVSNGYLIDQTKEWEYAFDAIPEAICVINIEHKIRFINKKLEFLLGKTRKEIFNKSCSDLFTSCTPLCVFSHCSEFPIKIGKFFIGELQGWYEIIQSPIKSPSNVLLGFICVFKDVTDVEIKKMELAASEEKYKMIIKMAPAAICAVDLVNSRFTEVNDVACFYTGYSCSDLLEMDARQLLTEESFRVFVSLLRRAYVKHEKQIHFEAEVIKKNGDAQWFMCNGALIYNQSGVPVEARIVAIDINEKKHAQSKLEQQTRMLNSIYASSPGGMGVVTYPERDIAWVNDKLCQITGYTKEELIGKNVSLLYPSKEDYDLVGQVKYRLMTEDPFGTATIKTKLKRKDGTILPVLLVSAKIQGEENRVVFNIIDLDFICQNIEMVCTG